MAAKSSSTHLVCTGCMKTAIGKSAARTCSRCRIASYCSEGCQRRHWRSHKLSCESITAQENDPIALTNHKRLTTKFVNEYGSILFILANLMRGKRRDGVVHFDSVEFVKAGRVPRAISYHSVSEYPIATSDGAQVHRTVTSDSSDDCCVCLISHGNLAVWDLIGLKPDPTTERKTRVQKKKVKRNERKRTRNAIAAITASAMTTTTTAKQQRPVDCTLD